MVRRRAFPAPAPHWYGLVGVGGGGGVCGEGRCLEQQLEGRGLLGAAREGRDLPQALHKPCNAGRVPVFLSILTCTFNPTTNPKPA